MDQMEDQAQVKETRALESGPVGPVRGVGAHFVSLRINSLAGWCGLGLPCFKFDYTTVLGTQSLVATYFEVRRRRRLSAAVVKSSFDGAGQPLCSRQDSSLVRVVSILLILPSSSRHPFLTSISHTRSSLRFASRSYMYILRFHRLELGPVGACVVQRLV